MSSISDKSDEVIREETEDMSTTLDSGAELVGDSAEWSCICSWADVDADR